MSVACPRCKLVIEVAAECDHEIPAVDLSAAAGYTITVCPPPPPDLPILKPYKREGPQAYFGGVTLRSGDE